MTDQGKTFLVIDGSSLAHRAFYALPLLSNRQGVHTNAAYGFLTMLLKILADEPVDYIAVAFDKGRITFRNEQYADYKGHRKATPSELVPQFGLIKELLQALRIPAYELDNFEADDLIGTLAAAAEEAGLQVSILTGDRDALQLISSQTKVLLTRKGISQMETYDQARISGEYGLEPRQLIDVKGLMGDASDNIPGVPGVGEKTAVKLIKQFASLEEVLANIEQISGPKLRENLKTFGEQARLSRQLATIVRQVPLEFSLDECLYRTPDYPALLEHYQQLEFNSLVPGVLEAMGREPVVSRLGADVKDVQKLANLSALQAIWQRVSGSRPLSLELAWEPVAHSRAKLRALGFATPEEAYGYVLQDGDEEAVLALIKDAALSHQQRWLLHDSKITIARLQRWGLPLTSPAGDTMLAAYLLNPSKGQRSLAEIVLEHLNVALTETEDLALDVGEKAALLHELHQCLTEQLAETEMLSLYHEIELPLVTILAAMETKGVKLDLGILEQMGQELAANIQELTKEICLLAGEEFNINSPKQLGYILFDKLGLPPLKRTKTGFSTNAEVLEELAPRHPIVAQVLAYRQLVKLQGTYIEGLQTLIDPDTQKVHTTFNQTATATGRLSSQEPNLQNIPIRLEQGRLIRRAFVPSHTDWLMLAADYSQIELRVLAHISQDENLMEAFIKGQDIHSRTASEVFGVPMAEVTPYMRRQAKAVNFGIVYGISDYGLGRDLGIPRKEAGEYIKLYFSRYPGVKAYIEGVILAAKEQGFVKTLLNRRRYLPDLFSSNRNTRSFGERTAMNTPIQGTAADIIKLAMIKVADSFRSHGMRTTMLLQVHDELIFEVPQTELALAVKLIRGAMETAVNLHVPLEVDLKVGPNWYDMEPLSEGDIHA